MSSCPPASGDALDAFRPRMEECRLLLQQADLFLVDCHTHLCQPHFASMDAVDAAVRNAKHSRVQHIILVGEDEVDGLNALQIGRQHPDVVRICLGVHPAKVSDRLQLEDNMDSSSCTNKALELFQATERLIRENTDSIVGLGECGLDFLPHLTKNEHYKDAQRFVLEQHVKLARELGDLPLNVHSRSAGRPTIELLQKCNARNVVLHAFDGRPAQAVAAAAVTGGNGFYFSIPASVVRQDTVMKLAAAVPPSNLLLETDSPALHPIKGPGMVNEPSNLLLTCDAVAKAKSLSVCQAAELTSSNAKKLFTRL